MSPHDFTPEYQRAFTAAEEAWLRWRKSPPGGPQDVARGHELTQAFIGAARAYCDHVESQTAVRLHYSTRMQSDEIMVAAAQSKDLDIPKFLHRSANQ